MPSSAPSSNDSQRLSETPSVEPTSPTPPPVKWKLNLVLFVATIGTVFATGMQLAQPGHPQTLEAAQFTGALLSILVAHEFGHFVAARLHRVDASLPFFIPLPPPASPFGTMGAIIRMRSRIPTRSALLDIGASGPLAGLALAIPLYAWGVAHSTLIPLDSDGSQLGESLMLRALDHFFAPATPKGMDVLLHPVAFAAWGAMLITMLNLLPVSQLDGGHVAYALFGPRQDRFARNVHRAVLAFFFVSLGSFLFRDVRAGLGLHHFGHAVLNALVWFVWFELLAVLGSLAGERRNREDVGVGTRVFGVVSVVALALVGASYDKTLIWIAWAVVLAMVLVIERVRGVLRPHDLLDHPPTGAAPLGAGRKAIALLTLAMFALLFMPTPFEIAL